MSKKIDKKEFDEVIKSEKVVLVDFYADWCGPCRMLGPIMDEISKEHDVYKINVDEEEELAASFGIMSIPCVVFFKEGKEVNRFVGLRSKAEILDMLK